MHWVYISPHFDDAVLSCGGLIWQQVQAGQTVEAWTICAGGPDPQEALSAFAQSLHDRWQTGPEAVPARLEEDRQALLRLGAEMRYWDLPDCIYRRLPDGNWLVNGEDDLWQPLHPLEEPVVERLIRWIESILAGQKDVCLVSPVSLGNHVDHRLVRAAVERAASRLELPTWYYPDYPYAAGPKGDPTGKIDPSWQQVCQEVSKEALRAWQEAVYCYTSQLSTFWGGREEMEAALEKYWQLGGGTCLWHTP